MPAGKSTSAAGGMMTGTNATRIKTTGGIGTIGDAQQAQLQRTQNAGHPLSGADSLAVIEHVSGTSSDVIPLASAIITATIAMKSTRLTASIVHQHAPPCSAKTALHALHGSRIAYPRLDRDDVRPGR